MIYKQKLHSQKTCVQLLYISIITMHLSNSVTVSFIIIKKTIVKGEFTNL